jgi:hypothetical protein
VRKALAVLAIAYLMLALLSKAKEAAGRLSCDCYPDCWCRKPGLSLFRWVFPRFHHNPGLHAWKKERLAPSRA